MPVPLTKHREGQCRAVIGEVYRAEISMMCCEPVLGVVLAPAGGGIRIGLHAAQRARGPGNLYARERLNLN
jgi:hypothetical protein